MKFLTSSHLKLLAIISMLVDHTAGMLLRGNEMMDYALLTIGDHRLTLYFMMKAFGRIAFPIFSFLIVEGFFHTRNKTNYGRNLFIFALLSEIPWNLIHGNSLLYPTQNVFFTLLLGYLGIYVVELFKNDSKRIAFLLVGLFIISIFLRADYGCRGFGFILLLYMLRSNKVIMSVVGACLLPSTWIGGMAFIPISKYNGKRGFIQGPFWKYAFYAFYPTHIFLLWLIRQYVL
ncbi:MAG: TraX protein [Mediterranea massiliensis]|nr:TraX protein [Mediterranea massiliensis]